MVCLCNCNCYVQVVFMVPLYVDICGHDSVLTPMSDQDRISPYNINAISSKQVMRIKKNINKWIIS